MTAPGTIDLAPRWRALVEHILHAHLPPPAEVWVFGSRATGRAKPYSDIDLAIDAGRRLRLDESAALSEAFSESDLPYKVDVVDWRAIGEGFRDNIAAERVKLPAAPTPLDPADGTPASLRGR